MWVYSSAALAYLACLAAVAVWRSKTAQTCDGFLVAGRALPPGVLTFTLLSAWIGAGSLFSGAGLAYRSGFPALWQPAGAWAGIALVYVIAPRVRRLARHTVPDLLEVHYGPAARLLASVTIAIAYATIVALQFRAGGRLLNLVSGIDPLAGAIAVAGFCVVCTAAAGMLSIAYLDVANGLTILAGVALALVFLIGQGGGLAPALSSLRPDQLTIFGALSPWSAVSLFLTTMLLLAGEASMYQKVLSARNEVVARAGIAGWIGATIVVETTIVALGVFGSVAVPGLAGAQSDAVVVRVATDVLPTSLGVLLLCGAAAIVVSTANSFLLAAASSLVRDVLQRFVDPALADSQVLLYTRTMVVVVGVSALVIGSLFPTSLTTTLWAYTMYAAGVTPALLAAFLWPGVARRAGVWSIAVGMFITIVWELIAAARGTLTQPAPLLGIQTIYPALLLSTGMLLAVSLTSRERAQAGSSGSGATS